MDNVFAILDFSELIKNVVLANKVLLMIYQQNHVSQIAKLMNNIPL